MEVIEKEFSETAVDLPYIPGLLAFREGPPMIETYKKLKRKPDILLVDGHGIAHPRGVGIASHVGVLLDIATIGIAKKRLVGDYRIPDRVGESRPLLYKGKVVGNVLKSKKGCNPIFISPGNKISVESSLEIVKDCIREHKLPEPVRLAHNFVNQTK